MQPEPSPELAELRLAAFWRAIREGAGAELREVLAREPALAHACDERGVSALLQARYGGRFAAVEALLEARTSAGWAARRASRILVWSSAAHS